MSTPDSKKDIKDKGKKEQSYVYVETSKSVSTSILDKFEAEGQKSAFKKSSKQVQKEVYGVGGLVSYPYAPANFLILNESNSVFSACVKQIAKDVAGLGWKLVLREGKKENETEKKKIQGFLDRPNPDDSLRTILNELLIDWGIIGWWGLEVVRDAKSEIAEIYHTPAHTFKIHKKKKKFFQKRGIKEIWFKAFGEDDNISAKDGKKGTYDLKTRANELIYYKNYYPRSDYYGAPNILSAIGSIIALIQIRDYNLSFFENYGVPAWMIVLKGKWADDSVKKITKFLNTEIKGSKNANKTIVFKVEEGDSMDQERVSDEVKEGSFKDYIQRLIDDVLISYSMPGYRIGLNIEGRLGGTNIRESTEIYKNGVVEPLQEDIEDMVNHKLIEQGLHCESYKFKLNDLDIRDVDAESKRCVRLINAATMTPNQARNKLGLGKPYTGGNKYYMKSGLEEVGEEELEKREDKFIKAMEDLQEGISKLAEGDFLKEAGKDEVESKD